MSVSSASSSKSRGSSGGANSRPSGGGGSSESRGSAVSARGGSGSAGRVTGGATQTPQNGNSTQPNPRDESRVSEEARKKKEEEESTRASQLAASIGEWATEGAEPEASPAAEIGETAEGAEVEGATEAAEASEGAEETTEPESETPQLELAEGETLGQGRTSSPEQVTQLQEMLNANGAELEVDGRFGPLTEAAVREYQQENDLQVDGVVGPQTMGSLNEGNSETADTEVAETQPEAPQVPGEVGQLSFADPNLSPAEQFEHYQQMIEANGGQLNTDGPTVIGLRGLGTDGSRHEGTSNLGGYDDSFVVLNRDAEGNPTVEVFSGATHANQRTSGASFGPDASGNTVRGVAMLQPGHYDVSYHSNNYSGRGAPSYHVTEDGSTYVPAFRDVDGNGTISATERANAINGGYQASDILFHAGSANAPISIGCLTMTPEVMNQFAQAVGRGGFDFTLLDANSSVVPG